MGDYQVPRLITNDVRCPKCGSPAILPSPAALRGDNVPRLLRRYQCARCGTEYQVRQQPPTVRSTILLVFIALALVALLLLIVF